MFYKAILLQVSDNCKFIYKKDLIFGKKWRTFQIMEIISTATAFYISI